MSFKTDLIARIDRHKTRHAELIAEGDKYPYGTDMHLLNNTEAGKVWDMVHECEDILREYVKSYPEKNKNSLPPKKTVTEC